MKLLLITHETSRTGAPMVLLHFLRWIRINQTKVEVDVLALNGGLLETDFREVCSTFYNFSQIIKPVKLKLWQRVLLKLGFFKKPNLKQNLLTHLSQNNYDVVYANTVVCLPLAQELLFKNNRIKVIAHIHELNGMIKMMMPNFNNYISAIDQFIVPSQLVKTNLIDNWDISMDKIEVVYECATINVEKKELREAKEESVFTIGASGTVDWRKGYDIFIQLARYLSQNNLFFSFKFIWVGNVKLQEQIIIKEDLEKLGLQDIVEFVGEQEKPSDYFKDFDVFLMTSREDPFPLVCIEIGMMGKPIISFDKAVGTNEILKKGGGFIVPYLSIESMAEKIIEYYKNPILKEAHGVLNKKVFSQFTPHLICPQLFSIIQKNIE